MDLANRESRYPGTWYILVQIVKLFGMSIEFDRRRSESKLPPAEVHFLPLVSPAEASFLTCAANCPNRHSDRNLHTLVLRAVQSANENSLATSSKDHPSSEPI